MPTVAEALIARHDLPPGVPAQAMGAMTGAPDPQPHPQSVGLRGITDLLNTVKSRTAALFGAPKPVIASPVIPQIPAPNIGALRTSQLESGLDALERRSTQVANPAPPITPPVTPMGKPTFDYGSFLQQNAMRTTEGKK